MNEGWMDGCMHAYICTCVVSCVSISVLSHIVLYGRVRVSETLMRVSVADAESRSRLLQRCRRGDSRNQDSYESEPRLHPTTTPPRIGRDGWDGVEG